MTKGNYTDLAKYDDLKLCSGEMRAQAAFKGISCFEMLQTGIVDDRLDGASAAFCLESIFQGVYSTSTVYTPETDQGFLSNSLPSPLKHLEQTESLRSSYFRGDGDDQK